MARPKTLLSMIEDSPSTTLQYALPFCLEFSIATMSTLQRSSHVESENYNVFNVPVLSLNMTKVYIRLQRQSLKQLGPLGWLSLFFLSLSFRISLAIRNPTLTDKKES